LVMSLGARGDAWEGALHNSLHVNYPGVVAHCERKRGRRVAPLSCCVDSDTPPYTRIGVYRAWGWPV